MKSPRLLLSKRRIQDFSVILKAYQRAGVNLGSFIDGGAGFGGTALKMAEHLCKGQKVFAFEPFPGNHRFFETPVYIEKAESRVVLVKKALGRKTGNITLGVPSVVEQNSTWGQSGKTGYSSAGRLVDREPEEEHDVIVECVRADEEFPKETKIGFVKLDLQGGELDALKGLGARLTETPLLWLEYAGQKDLFRFLKGQNFIVFDSSYLFFGEPNDAARHYFHIDSLDCKLSIGRKSWSGFRKDHWDDYFGNLAAMKTLFGLVQTDLLCVNKAFFEEFKTAMPFMKNTRRRQRKPLR